MRAEPSDGSMIRGLKEERDAEFKSSSPTMLETLEHKHIVSIELDSATTILLTEECDQWFSLELTKREFSQLIDELAALRDKMEE